ncbi:hypothetical protein COL922a_010368 [Colletotrichum nupharicola]|nr:hypothetical protein COL922a_010368 [Colletotrichum nupharicola]
MSMILRDQGFTKMTHEEWTTAVDPKVLGTWNLHNACVSSGLELDFFLLFSSISGTVGQKGQANYAGANTFLDAFVQYRHNLDMAAASIDVGAMMDYGYLAENPVMMEKLTAQGMYGVKIPQLLDAVSVLVNQPISQLSSVPTRTFVNPSQLILGHRSLTSLSDRSNRVIWKEDRRMAIYYNSNENDNEIDAKMSLQDAGLDSLVAVEMRSWWKGVFGFDISVLEMLGMGSLLALGERAAEGLKESQVDSNQETESGEKHSTEGYLRLKMP